MTKVVVKAAVEEVKAGGVEGVGVVGSSVGVSNKWGVKPCGELVMTKVVVSAGVEEVKDREVEGAGVVGDRSSVGVSDKLLVVGFSVVVLLVLLPDTVDIR